MFRAVAVVYVTLIMGCGPEPSAQRVCVEQPITNGTEHTGHPAVGRLLFTIPPETTKQNGKCTATLVGAKTVLVAAHCLGYANTDFVTDDQTAYKSVKSVKHSKFDKSTPYHYDLGVVILQSAPPHAPMKISAQTPVAGTALTMIGYGETSKGAGDNNVKRIATNKIKATKPLYFTITGASGSDGNACYGDSGGPVLVEEGGQEVLNGVLSYITGECGTTTYATRMDLYLSWLKTTASGDVLFHDIVKPKVTIKTPANGAEVDLDLTLEATATDAMGIVSVTVLVDGVEKGDKTTPPFDFPLTLAPGKRTLEVQAQDPAGNVGSAKAAVLASDPTVDSSVAIPDGGLPLLEAGGFPEAGFLDDAGEGDSGGDEPRGEDGCSYGDGGSRVGAGWLVLGLLLIGLLRRRG